MRRIIIGCVCIWMLFLNGCEKKEEAIIFESEGQEILEQSDVLGDIEEEESLVYVYVCGQVVSPGVYELSEDARVKDAIEVAGGMTEAAALTYLNQAEHLKDGQKIYVPTSEEIEREEQASAADGKVNLNTAQLQELMTLSGVGESKAQAIIQYRETQGAFTSIEDIMKIDGIKEGVFNRIKDKIKVE